MHDGAAAVVDLIFGHQCRRAQQSVDKINA
jgi:hypothetical protein